MGTKQCACRETATQARVLVRRRGVAQAQRRDAWRRFSGYSLCSLKAYTH